MKKTIVTVAIVCSLCLSFFAGNYFSDKENLESREYRCHTLVVFAIDKMEDLKIQYDTDTMEALISDIYAAYEYSDDAELSAALHDLWNALIFDGENIAGKEDILIAALKEFDAQSIKDLAVRMRSKEEEGGDVYTDLTEYLAETAQEVYENEYVRIGQIPDFCYVENGAFVEIYKNGWLLKDILTVWKNVRHKKDALIGFYGAGRRRGTHMYCLQRHIQCRNQNETC